MYNGEGSGQLTGVVIGENIEFTITGNGWTDLYTGSISGKQIIGTSIFYNNDVPNVPITFVLNR